MLTLKDYQHRTLDALAAYFTACAASGDAKAAFEAETRKAFGAPLPYTDVKELPGLPYVCLRLPTGGGKTLLACHAVGAALRNLMRAETTVVLWLVPSNAIREQTIQALKNRKHHYRQALESSAGRVEVLDVEEALYATRSTLDTATTVIVSTMQSFRVEDTVGRRVYRQNGSLSPHFDGLPAAALASAEKHDDGRPVPSLANVLNIRRPVVIVDEAHNARTDLSFETLARFNPSCIVEFTATPDRERNASNVLHSVSAAELQAESMIKMPIRLETRADWRELLSDAIACRDRLEKLAALERQDTGEYLRPIMLIQAQPHRKDDPDVVTVETVVKTLVDDHKIPRDRVAVATGVENELDDVKDISDPACLLRYVVTMQALREGWDCPFAYVLCSVTEMHSSTYVEQILGRVMRLPRAERKKREELNMAYAFAAAEFSEIAERLADGLVSNGFERQEARDFIVRAPAYPPQGALWDDSRPFLGTFTVDIPEAPDMGRLAAPVASRVVVDARDMKLTFQGMMSEGERDAIKACFPTENGKASVESAYRLSNGFPTDSKATPSECGVHFDVPALSVKQGALFEPFEETHLLERHWDLAASDALLTEAEYGTERTPGRTGEVFVTENGKVRSRFLDTLRQQLTIFAGEAGWSVADLVNWLDRALCAASWRLEFSPAESGVFLTKAVRSLVEQRGIPLDRLVQDKYRLKQAIASKIAAHRGKARSDAYQAFLLPGVETPLVVTPAVCFSYLPKEYPFNTRYQGRYEFEKHYYPEIGDLAAEGEEFECAQHIDQNASVEFWVRNLSNRPRHSFWLQTSTDRFYPDFVCKLTDGRFLVVEYKGEIYSSTRDTEEKKALGELWEQRSDGRCRFAMPTGKDWSAIKAAVRR